MSNQVPTKLIMTTSAPVEFTQDQADAFEEFSRDALAGSTFPAEMAAGIVLRELVLLKQKHTLDAKDIGTRSNAKHLLSVGNVAQALYNGYVIKQTPLDKLHTMFEKQTLSYRVALLDMLKLIEKVGITREDITAFLDEKGVSRRKPVTEVDVQATVYERETEEPARDSERAPQFDGIARYPAMSPEGRERVKALTELFNNPSSAVDTHNLKALNGWQVGIVNALRFARDHQPSRNTINSFLVANGFLLKEEK